MTAPVQQLLNSAFESAVVTVTADEPIRGGYNSLMSRICATVDGTPHSFTVRQDHPAERRLVDVDRSVEWALLQHIAATCPELAPAPVACDLDDPSTLVLEWVHGSPAAAHANSYDGSATDIVGLMARHAARIHATKLDGLPANVPKPVDWETHVDSLVAEWRKAEAEHIEPDPLMRAAASWLTRHRPPPMPLGLVHGDFQTSNVLITEDRSVSTVDWEFAHIGDPREDLGWLQIIETLSPPPIYGPNPEGFCAAYRAESGADDSMVNPEIIGWFSVLVMGQRLRSLMQQVAALCGGATRSPMILFAAAAAANYRQTLFSTMLALEGAPSLVRAASTDVRPAGLNLEAGQKRC